MDTKLKNNKKNYILSIITIIILVITSISMINLYPEIDENAKKRNTSPYENYSFLSSLYKINNVLYKDIEEQKEGKELLPVQLFFKGYSGSQNDYNSYAQDRINKEIINWERTLKNDYRNLEYLVVDSESNISTTNTEEDFSILLKEENQEATDLLKDKYAFYMVVNLNEKGDINIKDMHGANIDIVNSRFSEKEISDFINVDSTVIFEAARNMDVVYGVSKNLKYEDTISYIIESTNEENYMASAAVYIIIAIIIIVLFALILPYKKWKNVIGIGSFVKIPFEIVVVIISGVIVPLIIQSGWLILGTQSGAFLQSLMNTGLSSEMLKIGLFLINVIWWTVLMGMVLMAVVSLKHIFNTGFKRYIREYTLIYKIVRSAKRGSVKLYNYVTDIDLRDKTNKSIIKILGVNFIILVIMCSIWFFGIGTSIIYTIVLFVLLKKYADDIKLKYEILLKATNKIAEGNLEVVIEDELGVFEPFKEEIEKIQEGFKKAVDEEVKSQKMKTDLISNVSHDLKTPLTSIITYVDLLKDENISEEEKKSYIDTIDRKSQRLKTLIEDLFEVSKATSKNVQLNIIDVDIVSLMKQTQFELSDKIEQSSLNFKLDFPEEKVVLQLDSQKTFRVFENLLMNIIKYSMPNSRVYIDIINEEEEVKISLKNMSAEEISFNSNDIVERFVRGDKSRNTEGTGLGLAIAKSFVEIQGGAFNIETDGDLFKVNIIFKK